MREEKTITMGGLEDFCEILKAAENRVGFTIENNTLSDCEIVKVKKKIKWLYATMQQAQIVTVCVLM